MWAYFSMTFNSSITNTDNLRKTYIDNEITTLNSSITSKNYIDTADG
jgi:hypothetical protein